MPSLFAVKSAPAEDDTSAGEDFASDLMPADDEMETDPMELGGGPFDAYADTVLDAEADPADRKDALRQAILTLIEEQGK